MIEVAVPWGYPVPFCFDLGQRNARLTRTKFVRGSAVLPWLDALTFARPRRCDLVHTLNAVPLRARTPYAVTFESFLPRVPDDRPWPALERFLMRRLLQPQCRRILAFSEFAMRQLRVQIERHPGAESLLEKAEVLRPAAPIAAAHPKDAPRDTLRLLFVGRDFARKGGPAVVRAHELLVEAGVPVETTVVSSLGWNPKGVVGPSSKTLIEEEHARLRRSGIRHLMSLPNDEVMRAMAASDFLLLPTVNDTFGFVCLEAMGCGTPVIGTSTYALPEIVADGQSGFLLDVPNDGVVGRWEHLARRWEPGYDTAYLALMESLAGQMAARLAAFWSERTGYPDLSRGALARMAERFDPVAARDRLECVYEDAVRGSEALAA